MKRNKGFTLIEVLITLVIISSLVLGVNKFLYTIKKANIISEEIFQIINYSQNIMEYLKSENVELLEGEYQLNNFIDSKSLKLFKESISENVITSSNINIENIYNFSNLDKKLYLVKLSIYWQGLKGEKVYELNNYISK